MASSSSSPVFQAGKTAVITGGASGIGLALAKKCTGYGMKVVVADYNADALKAAAAADNNIRTIEMDVSSLEDWAKLKNLVDSELGGQINLLALNAGTGARHSFEDADPAVFRKIIDTNLYGVLNGITTMLPVVKATESEAAIVITGSKQGITNPPGNPAYNASKSAVKTLAEQLSYELSTSSSSKSISVHLLVPGWTWTPLAGAAGGGEKPPAAWYPEQVVDFLEGKMSSKEFWVLCPDNEVTEAMDRRRILWSSGDAVEGRPPLSRWREEGGWKGKAGEFLAREG